MVNQGQHTVTMLAVDKSRYLLIWFSEEPISPRNLIPVRRKIEDTVKEPKAEVEIDIWLESGGGDAHAAFKLALMLRDAASHIRVVVPDVAKSAATLLALAGHEIFMAPGADLGPLDAQVLDEGPSVAGFISALNVARAADEVARDAVALALKGGANLLSVTGLSRAKTLEAMLQFSASFSQPLVCQLDPKTVYHAKQLLRVTKQYAKKLLTSTVGEHRADQIAMKLVEDFPTHGYVVCYEDCERLGLPVRPIVEYDLIDRVRRCHRVSEMGQDVVLFDRIEEAVDADNGGNDHGEDVNRGEAQEAGEAGAFEDATASDRS